MNRVFAVAVLFVAGMTLMATEAQAQCSSCNQSVVPAYSQSYAPASFNYAPQATYATSAPVYQTGIQQTYTLMPQQPVTSGCSGCGSQTIATPVSYSNPVPVSTYSQPTYAQPTYTQPTYATPTTTPCCGGTTTPAYSTPAYSTPVTSYSAPVVSTPVSYGTTAYAAPVSSGCSSCGQAAPCTSCNGGVSTGYVQPQPRGLRLRNRRANNCNNCY